jgi:hypothetical protein
VNLAQAAKEMGEKGGPPSAETVDMIHDRMGYNAQAAEDAARSRLQETLAPGAAEDAPTELERQLQASVDAANGKKTAIGDPGTVEQPPQQYVNPRRPIMAMGRQQMPAGSWVTPEGKVELLDRATGESHGNAYTRLMGKKAGDSAGERMDTAIGRCYSGSRCVKPSLGYRSFRQAARTSEAAQTGSIIVVHSAGDPIEVGLERQGEFLRNPRKWIRRSIPGAR